MGLRTALPANDFIMAVNSDTPIPVGVVGCGRMGSLHARAYTQLPGVKLAAVHDLNGERSTSVARQFDCQSVASIDAMLSLVQAVTIAVPTQFHAPVAEKFLRR